MLPKVIINSAAFGAEDSTKVWHQRGIWPAQWLYDGRDSGLATPRATAFRCSWNQSQAESTLIHCFADSCYWLYLDGELVASGPERGDIKNSFFDSWNLNTAPGEHTLVAVVFFFGNIGPCSRMTYRSGWVLGAEGNLASQLNTKPETWQYCNLDGITFKRSKVWYMGCNAHIDRRQLPDGLEKGQGNFLSPTPSYAEPVRNEASANEYWPGVLLTPATLPALDRSAFRPGALKLRYADQLSGNHYLENQSEAAIMQEAGEFFADPATQSYTIEANSKRRFLIEFDNYYTFNYELFTSGGRDSVITASYAEALFPENEMDVPKKRRDLFDDCYFFGLCEEFTAGGGASERFFAPHYRAGRWLEVQIVTGNEPLTLRCWKFNEERFPMAVESSFDFQNEDYRWLGEIAERTLAMCSHDTFMDCPYYEQLMYIGDLRMQILTQMQLIKDPSLIKKSLRLLSGSMIQEGFLQSRYPSQITQVISNFSLVWILTLADYAEWRQDPGFIREMLPTVRRIIDGFAPYQQPGGELVSSRFWNFVDWAWPQWGFPEGGDAGGLNSPNNFFFIYALTAAAKLHKQTNQSAMADIYTRRALAMTRRMVELFWDETTGLFADTTAKTSFSEHQQCLALLSDTLPLQYSQRLNSSLFGHSKMTRCTVYFSFYFMEVCYKLKKSKAFYDRLQIWFDMRSSALKTLLERPEPSRSDCHAWSSHALFHIYASIFGVRPMTGGPNQVVISPMPGELKVLKGEILHPSGLIKIDLELDSNCEWHGEIKLPEGVIGVIEINQQKLPLPAGGRSI